MNIERHISNLKQYIKDDEIIEKDGSDFANFCKGHIDDIQAVLNELEKKEAEIDKLRKSNKDLLKKLRNRVKEVKKLTRYSLYKKEFATLNKQLEKKDKVIDEMAGYIMYLDIDEDICMKNTTNTELCNEKYTNCKECIKEYFYKRVSEE